MKTKHHPVQATGKDPMDSDPQYQIAQHSIEEPAFLHRGWAESVNLACTIWLAKRGLTTTWTNHSQFFK